MTVMAPVMPPRPYHYSKWEAPGPEKWETGQLCHTHCEDSSWENAIGYKLVGPVDSLWAQAGYAFFTAGHVSPATNPLVSPLVLTAEVGTFLRDPTFFLTGLREGGNFGVRVVTHLITYSICIYILYCI